MSALFFKVSWPATVDRYRSLQAKARSQGFSLVVRNTSRTRNLPFFMFFLDKNDGKPASHFSHVDEVATVLEATPEKYDDETFISIGEASGVVLQGLGHPRPRPSEAASPRHPFAQGVSGVISTTIQYVEAAEPVLDSGRSWVTLRLGGDNRVTIHTVNYGQAVAVADAFNSELEARQDGRR